MFCESDHQRLTKPLLSSKRNRKRTRVAEPLGEEEKREIPEFLWENFRTDNPDVIPVVCAGLVDVDDDNEPVPDNIPRRNTNTNEDVQFEKESGHGGVCFRQSSGATDRLARLCNHEWNLQLKSYRYKWIKEVLIVETNKGLEMGELYYGEFLQFIGIWLKISTQVGFHDHEFWSEKQRPDT